MADLETDVPEKGKKLLQAPFPGRRFSLGKEHTDVDIRTGVELAATVTADRDQCEFVHALADVQRPGTGQQTVNEPRAIAHEVFN